MQEIKDILLRALEVYLHDPETGLVSVTDALLEASVHVSKIAFRVIGTTRLSIGIGDGNFFEVDLQDRGVSSFRAILARIGTICGETARKSSLTGKAEAFLKRNGMLADRCLTERDRQIRFVEAEILDQPGSPLYKLSAKLVIKLSDGLNVSTHVEMQNEPHALSLTLTNESYKPRGLS